MKFLYAQVSSNDGSQKIDRQTTDISKYDEVFEDYASGGSTNRPKLQEMLKNGLEKEMLLKLILLAAWLVRSMTFCKL